MKKNITFLLTLAVIANLGVFIFLFWATSSQLGTNEQNLLIINSFQQKIANDTIHSIVTFNIGHLTGPDYSIEASKTSNDRNLARVKTLFDSINPDIIAFQDIDFNSDRSFNINQPQEIAKLGYNYVAEAINWDNNYIPSPVWPPKKQIGKVLSGHSVLSKFKINSNERIELVSNENLVFYKKAFTVNRVAQVVKMMVGNRTMVVINIHLDDVDKSTRLYQFNQVLEVFDKFAKEFPTILLGDFNSFANKKNAIIHNLLERPDVGHSKYLRLDHIFFTKNSIDIINSRVLDQFNTSSSHLPLLMEFRLK